MSTTKQQLITDQFAIYNSDSTNNAAAAMFNRLVTATYINFATSNTLAVTVTITN